MDFNSWFNYRFKLRNAGQPTELDKAWEPAAPDFYRQLFLDEGFTDDLQFARLSYEVPSKAHWQAYMHTLRAEYDAVTSQHRYSIRPLHSGSELLQDLRRIFDLSNIAFADNPMFEVIPFEIFSAMTMAMARSANIGASRIVLSSSGEAVGFAFCFVDNDELVYKTVAVHPDHRSMGIANSLTYEISAYCVEHSLLKTTGALIRSGNASEKIGRRHGNFAQPTKINQYSLLRKVL
jgi:GNAT superfamily N-acetyltransferase